MPLRCNQASRTTSSLPLPNRVLSPIASSRKSRGRARSVRLRGLDDGPGWIQGGERIATLGIRGGRSSARGGGPARASAACAPRTIGPHGRGIPSRCCRNTQGRRVGGPRSCGHFSEPYAQGKSREPGWGEAWAWRCTRTRHRCRGNPAKGGGLRSARPKREEGAASGRRRLRRTAPTVAA